MSPERVYFVRRVYKSKLVLKTEMQHHFAQRLAQKTDVNSSTKQMQKSP